MSFLNKRDPLRYLAARLPRPKPRVYPGSVRAYGIDISHWEESFDPDQAANGLIDFAIFKATEGTTWVDSAFESFYSAAAGKVWILGAYHYLRSGMDARAQAEHFLSVTAGKEFQILVCDFESTNNTMDDSFVEAAQVFGSYVKQRRPDARLLFYTNPSTYDDVVYPGCMRLYGIDVFTRAPWDGFWVAQYYFDPSPNKNPSMPKNRSDWVMWQYSEAGDPDLHGTGGWCDQNVFNGFPSDLSDWISNGTVPPDPPGDIVEIWFDDKVIYTRGHRDSPRSFNFHVTRFKRSDISRLHINGLGFHGNGLYFWETRGEPDIVINGGHADYSKSPPVPFAVVVSDGRLEKSEPSEVSIQFDNQNQPIGMLWFADKGAYNSVGISDVLLQDGIIPASVRFTDVIERVKSVLPRVDDTYVDPRNAMFWTDSEYILICIDGRNDGTLGLTRLELAQFALSLGARWGGNLDGGGSNTLIYNDAGVPAIMNNPPDGSLRSVANHVGFWISGGSAPPIGGDMDFEVVRPTTLRRWRPPNIKGEYGNLPTGMVLTGKGFTPDNLNLIIGYDPLNSDNSPDYVVSMADLRPYDPTTPPDPPAGDGSYTVTVTVGQPGYISATHTVSGTLDPE